MQPLKHPVEVVHRTNVVTVKKDFRIFRRDLESQGTVVIEEGNLGQYRRGRARKSDSGGRYIGRCFRTDPHQGASD
jgi:hypothetical protein